jgi:RTX calcium-binding nonapeptide repeat (4 copies)
MMNKHFIVITAVMVIGLFGLSATANSQETFESVIPDFLVTCTSTGQLCDPAFSVSGEIGSVLQVQYFVRSTHCSSLRVHLFVDGTLKVTTEFLGWPGAPSPFAELPLDTGLVDLGPVSPGAHLIGVQAEGQVSGCNLDQPGSWGGSLKVLTNVPISPLTITDEPPDQLPDEPPDEPPVLCNGLPATIVGDSNSNRIFGTPDKLFGDAGNDVLKGGTGRDRLSGQSGNDAMDGQSGSDRCDGGSRRTDKARRCERTTRVP